MSLRSIGTTHNPMLKRWSEMQDCCKSMRAATHNFQRMVHRALVKESLGFPAT